MNKSKLFNQYTDYLFLKNYSSATKRAYLNSLKHFIYFCQNHRDEFSGILDYAKAYLVFRFKQGKSWRTVNIDYSCLKSLCEHVLYIDWDINVHMIFTLPHQLNGLARSNKKIIYSLILKTSWAVVKSLSKTKNNIGGIPGMVSVLHTFGSDMKYHIHTHNLVTFGALDLTTLKWKKPKRNDKIARYRQINSQYKRLFLQALKREYLDGKITYYMNYEQVEEMVKDITWVVHNTKPTLDTSILEGYLARYINRIAVSNSKVEYLKDQAIVKLIYNDYKNQQEGQPAPKAYKSLDPLVFINQFIQHVLPPYFQKTRRYGLHSSATKKKYKELLPQNLHRQADIVRTVIQIVSKLINNLPYSCQKCQSEIFEIVIVKPNKNWIYQYIDIPNSRSPPKSSYKLCHIT